MWLHRRMPRISPFRRASRATNLHPTPKPEGPAFTRAIKVARKARFRSADGLSSARSAKRTIIAVSAKGTIKYL
jgi:hypothetical protein